MEFKVFSGGGKSNRCPKCGSKLRAILSKGTKRFVCHCGYWHDIKKYAKNAVNTKLIPKS